MGLEIKRWFLVYYGQSGFAILSRRHFETRSEANTYKKSRALTGYVIEKHMITLHRSLPKTRVNEGPV